MKKVVVLLALLLCISLIFFQVAESTNFSTKQTPTHLIRQKTTPGSVERILVGLRTPNNKVVIQPFKDKSSGFTAISLNSQPKRIILDTYEDDLWVVEGNTLNT